MILIAKASLDNEHPPFREARGRRSPYWKTDPNKGNKLPVILDAIDPLDRSTSQKNIL